MEISIFKKKMDFDHNGKSNFHHGEMKDFLAMQSYLSKLGVGNDPKIILTPPLFLQT